MTVSSRRVAVLSGASRGIGAAVARELARQGWALSLGLRGPPKDAAAPGPEGSLVCDYDARVAGSERPWIAATVERFGRIDAVIVSAGIMIPKTVIEAEESDLESLLEINVKAPFRLVRAAWPWLRKAGRGRVVIVASLSGKRVKAARAGTYSVSKFAALGLTHAIRHAGWADGIRATAICPGFVATDMAASVSSEPLASMTQPEDLARLVALAVDLPNTTSQAEIAVNCWLEEAY